VIRELLAGTLIIRNRTTSWPVGHVGTPAVAWNHLLWSMHWAVAFWSFSGAAQTPIELPLRPSAK
jgi:hypothetical protein